MESYRQWTILISTVCIVSGILVSVIPKGKMKKSYKMLTVAVLIYAAIFPLANLDVDNIDWGNIFSSGLITQEELEEKSESSVLISAENAISSLILKNLSENKMNVTDVTVKCEYKDDKLSVKSIEIAGNLSESDQRKCTDIIMSILENGKNTKLIFQGESNE